jgi:SAM-dependent methyltransferase
MMTPGLSIKRHEKYYEALGPVPEGNLSSLDYYRFELVKRHICGKSVLDVGCARGDFLKLIKSEYQIAGIEATKKRAEDCNKILDQDVVRVCNVEEGIGFEDNNFDTVVCMEVLEHLINPQETLEHLIRISRIRTIITVPYDEKIKWILCIHCAKYTPVSGHLHSFNEVKLKQYIDGLKADVKRIKLSKFGNSFLRFVPSFVPFRLKFLIDKIFCKLFPRHTKWILLIVDKRGDI